jgi:hypothetical protein
MVDKLGTGSEYQVITCYLLSVSQLVVTDVSFVGYEGFGNDALNGGQIGY